MWKWKIKLFLSATFRSPAFHTNAGSSIKISIDECKSISGEHESFVGHRTNRIFLSGRKKRRNFSVILSKTYFRWSFSCRRKTGKIMTHLVNAIHRRWKHASECQNQTHWQHKQRRSNWFENRSVKYVFRHWWFHRIKIEMLEIMWIVINLKASFREKFSVFLESHFIDYTIHIRSRHFSQKLFIWKLQVLRMKMKNFDWYYFLRHVGVYRWK